jgi:3-oxoacyl-[acyl-carrier protein] reductase
MDSLHDLSGHVAVITGGTRNIGLATAKLLRAQGAKVCVVGGSDAASLGRALDELDGPPNEVTGLLADVSDPRDIDTIFEHAETHLGVVTILVNGAANRPHKAFTEITREEWDQVLGTVLTGAFMLSQKLHQRLPQDRKGAIVNLGGLSAHKPATERPHVIAAKAGLQGLTRALAMEGLGRIRANMVIPGAIETERKPGQSVPHKANEPGVMPPGTSQDVARVILAMADPQDQYTTGQSIHVNGARFMP